jgi:hypothetical protein
LLAEKVVKRKDCGLVAGKGDGKLGGEGIGGNFALLLLL